MRHSRLKYSDSAIDAWPVAYQHGTEAGQLLLEAGGNPREISRAALALLDTLPHCSDHPDSVADCYLGVLWNGARIEDRLCCTQCAEEALASEEIEHVDVCEWRSHFAVLEGIAHAALEAWAGETEQQRQAGPGTVITRNRGDVTFGNLGRSTTENLKQTLALVVSVLARHPSRSPT